MAMGLAVTWCDALRRLMGRAAPRQQGPNEVRHRFSPPCDHDNLKVLQHDILRDDGEQDITCSTDGAWGPVRQQTSCSTRRWLRRGGWCWRWWFVCVWGVGGVKREIGCQYHQSTFCWPREARGSHLSPAQMLFGHSSTGRDSGGDLVQPCAPAGRVSIITGLTQSCVRKPSVFYSEGLWLMMCGGEKLQNVSGGIWFSGSSQPSNEE